MTHRLSLAWLRVVRYSLRKHHPSLKAPVGGKGTGDDSLLTIGLSAGNSSSYKLMMQMRFANEVCRTALSKHNPTGIQRNVFATRTLRTSAEVEVIRHPHSCVFDSPIAAWVISNYADSSSQSTMPGLLRAFFFSYICLSASER